MFCLVPYRQDFLSSLSQRANYAPPHTHSAARILISVLIWHPWRNVQPRKTSLKAFSKQLAWASSLASPISALLGLWSKRKASTQAWSSISGFGQKRSQVGIFRSQLSNPTFTKRRPRKLKPKLVVENVNSSSSYNVTTGSIQPQRDKFTLQY